MKEEDLSSEDIDLPTAAGSSSTLSESQYTHVHTSLAAVSIDKNYMYHSLLNKHTFTMQVSCVKWTYMERLYWRLLETSLKS